jgi:hypothetical protein
LPIWKLNPPEPGGEPPARLSVLLPKPPVKAALISVTGAVLNREPVAPQSSEPE